MILRNNKGGQGRKPIYPKDYPGKTEVQNWKTWATDQHFSIMSIGKRCNMLRSFFVFTSAQDICKDFCEPYMIEGHTIVCDHCRAKKRIKELTCNVQTKDLTWQHLEAWKSYLTGAPKKPTKKRLDEPIFRPEFRWKTTINHNITVVQSWFEMKADKAKTDKWRNRYHLANTVRKLKHAYKRPHKAIPLEDIFKLMDEAKKESYESYAVLMLLLYTGGRAQFYALPVEDIHWGKENGETSEGIDPKDMGKIVTKTKFGKDIEVPLHPKLQKVLRHHLATRDDPGNPMLFKYARVPKSLNDFTANEHAAWRLCKRLAEKAGVKGNIYTHRIRKTVGKYGPKLGIDPRFMQEILTHEDFSTTENIYREIDFEDVAEAWSRVDFESYMQESSTPDIDGICRELDRIVELMPENFKPAMSSMVEGMKGLIRGAMGNAT